MSSLLDRYDLFLFDCDGVLWQGDLLLPGALELLRTLQRLDKKFAFVTNNAAKSRKDYLPTFREKFGLEMVQEDHVHCSSHASAEFLEGKLGKNSGAKVVHVGMAGLKTELENHGMCVVEHEVSGAVGSSARMDAIASLPLDAEVRAVVVGLDRTFDYTKMAIASMYLQESPDCLFIATNQDAGISHGSSLEKKRILPGAGSVVAAVERASGREPITIGKPSKWWIEHILGQYPEVEKSRAVFFGDRLETDIAFALAGGIDSVLVLTGVTTLEMYRNSTEYRATYVFESLTEILQKKQSES